ncbi:hypothetical protein [Actinoplanes sp. NPDC026619]|uniref:hypothetical protein n=1 Tax=Actinoplanes sp. NPDC026619 TaxID=3155798 RepID=UPI0033CF76B0
MIVDVNPRMTDLAAVGNVVDESYRHVTKVAAPGPPLTLPDVYLKWYRLHREDQVISVDAHAFLATEITAGRLPLAGDLGFVVHHLSGDHVHLLLVCTWRGNNEMWETVYARDLRTDADFHLMPQTTHRGVMCVWEFAPIAHEHQAWTRYLRSPRDTEAKTAYAETQFSGFV